MPILINLIYNKIVHSFRVYKYNLNIRIITNLFYMCGLFFLMLNVLKNSITGGQPGLALLVAGNFSLANQ